MEQLNSQFALRYADGTYHATGRSNGFNTLEHSSTLSGARKFDGKEYAIAFKNNQAHLRWLPMTLVEIRREAVECGEVPVTEPDWDDYDADYDRQEFERRWNYALSQRT